MEVVASLSQGHTAAAQCGLFTHKSVLIIFEPHCISYISMTHVNIQGVPGGMCETLGECSLC